MPDDTPDDNIANDCSYVNYDNGYNDNDNDDNAFDNKGDNGNDGDNGIKEDNGDSDDDKIMTIIQMIIFSEPIIIEKPDFLPFINVYLHGSKHILLSPKEIFRTLKTDSTFTKISILTLTVCRCFQGVEKGCTGNEWVEH